jgi:hypothetical protein
MSTENDVARSLGSWLKENRHEDADRVLDVVFDQIPATPQRRTFWLARRFLEMKRFARVSTVAFAVLAIVIVGLVLARGTNVGGPTPTVVPTPTPPLLNTVPVGDLAAGTYQIDAVFPVRLSFTVPTGFNHGSGAADDVGIGYNGSGTARGIDFQVASNVYPDPCHSSSGSASPPIGPGVDDLVTAMTNLVGFQPGPVTDVTIGGFPAKSFDLTNNIDLSTCDRQGIQPLVFAGTTDTSSIVPGERQRIYVMNVSGTRLMIMTYYFQAGDATAEADAAASLKAIVESIEIL